MNLRCVVLNGSLFSDENKEGMTELESQRDFSKKRLYEESLF